MILVWCFISFLYMSYLIVCVLPYFDYYFGTLFGGIQNLLGHYLLGMTALTYYLAIKTKYE